jgi:hypothetical protein
MPSRWHCWRSQAPADAPRTINMRFPKLARAAAFSASRFSVPSRPAWATIACARLSLAFSMLAGATLGAISSNARLSVLIALASKGAASSSFCASMSAPCPRPYGGIGCTGRHHIRPAEAARTAVVCPSRPVRSAWRASRLREARSTGAPQVWQRPPAPAHPRGLGSIKETLAPLAVFSELLDRPARQTGPGPERSGGEAAGAITPTEGASIAPAPHWHWDRVPARAGSLLQPQGCRYDPRAPSPG